VLLAGLIENPEESRQGPTGSACWGARTLTI
jgi:hypothetical protein